MKMLSPVKRSRVPGVKGSGEQPDVDDSRRKFLTDYSRRQAGNVVKGFVSGLREAGQKATFDQFFESYASSYALTLAYPDEIIIESAKKAGIETEGRKKIDIVRDLFEKERGY
jgi:hypothetical protein